MKSGLMFYAVSFNWSTGNKTLLLMTFVHFDIWVGKNEEGKIKRIE